MLKIETFDNTAPVFIQDLKVGDKFFPAIPGREPALYEVLYTDSIIVFTKTEGNRYESFVKAIWKDRTIKRAARLCTFDEVSSGQIFKYKDEPTIYLKASESYSAEFNPDRPYSCTFTSNFSRYKEASFTVLGRIVPYV